MCLSQALSKHISLGEPGAQTRLHPLLHHTPAYEGCGWKGELVEIGMRVMQVHALPCGRGEASLCHQQVQACFRARIRWHVSTDVKSDSSSIVGAALSKDDLLCALAHPEMQWGLSQKQTPGKNKLLGEQQRKVTLVKV
ncbi:POU domain, class 3, transcription factor 4 [Platysternon megacephalum]|uniref:POU domain, class 3, transcription factor 4 n=1 Tax=Platysternon megacephalum TaxID=55544 RepID=A0A4D9EQZ2_9SAUR|nr:POU domain, class 3, transcription factor 4 [Platysternon megacephalum]